MRIFYPTIELLFYHIYLLPFTFRSIRYLFEEFFAFLLEQWQKIIFFQLAAGKLISHAENKITKNVCQLVNNILVTPNATALTIPSPQRAKLGQCDSTDLYEGAECKKNEK